MPSSMTIGELSRRTGCNIETIRYYERIGIIPAPPRRGTYRSFSDNDAARLGFVRRARELGFTLEQVRTLLTLAKGDQSSCGEVRELAAVHLADVQARIADLLRMESVLTDAVRACDAGETGPCPLIQVLWESSPSEACRALPATS
jgi:MerR family mercuric resistance operon transcriptional regulator